MDLQELDRLRLQRGWSKADLAAAMGVTAKTVSVLYRDASASPALLRKLTNALAENRPSRLVTRLMGEAREAGVA